MSTRFICIWTRQWHPTPVLLPGKSHGRRSLEGCGPWGCWGSDTTERLYFHFSLSCIGEGNGNPLQCFCLENPRDGGAWWAAVYGVAQSRTWLKWLSSRAWFHVSCFCFKFWIHGFIPMQYARTYFGSSFNYKYVIKEFSLSAQCHKIYLKQNCSYTLSDMILTPLLL